MYHKNLIGWARFFKIFFSFLLITKKIYAWGTCPLALPLVTPLQASMAIAMKEGVLLQ